MCIALGHGACFWSESILTWAAVALLAILLSEILTWKCNACLRHCWTGSCRVLQEPLAPLHVASILWSILQHPDVYSGQPCWCLPGVDIWATTHSQALVTSAQTQKARFLWTTLLMTQLNRDHTANTHILCTCVQEYVSFAPRNRKSS